VSCLQAVNDRFQSAGITGRANWEWRLSTHLGRSPQSSRGQLRVRRRQSFAYSGKSLTRMSSPLTPSTPATASLGSAPCRTRAFDQLVWPGGR
jgi:hypothetical protein